MVDTVDFVTLGHFELDPSTHVFHLSKPGESGEGQLSSFLSRSADDVWGKGGGEPLVDGFSKEHAAATVQLPGCLNAR